MSRVLIRVWGGMVAGDYMDSQEVMQATTEGLRFALPRLAPEKGAARAKTAELKQKATREGRDEKAYSRFKSFKGAISIELARLVGINGSVNKHRGERDGSGG